MRVLVTGAGGFAGRALVRELKSAGHEVRGVVRSPGSEIVGADTTEVHDFGQAADLSSLMTEIDAVVHLAAKVHDTEGDGPNAEAAYQRINVDATVELAKAAAEGGVRRFLFVSSVKANGEATPDGPFTEESDPAPQDPYGRSKWDAERALRALPRDEIEIVVIRPPLVYGPGVKAHFLSLLRLCDTPLPIPLGAARNNPRSMIFLGNLTSAMRRALENPVAAGRTYLVRDGDDMAPADLIARLRRALGRRANLIDIPERPIAALAAAIGKRNISDRLFESLRVDDARIRGELDWRPPFTVYQGLASTAAWYKTGVSD